MRWIKKGIRRKNIDVLDISSTDTEEIDEMGEERKNVSAVQMQLNEMHLLSFFPNAKTLILTGGIPAEDDFIA